LRNAYLITLSAQVIATVLGCIAAVGPLREATRSATPWAFSLRLWSSSALDSLGGRLDLLLLTALTSATTVGVYAVAVTCAAASGELTQALNQLAYSRFAASDFDKSSNTLSLRAKYGAIMSVAVGAAVVGAVALFGE